MQIRRISRVGDFSGHLEMADGFNLVADADFSQMSVELARSFQKPGSARILVSSEQGQLDLASMGDLLGENESILLDVATLKDAINEVVDAGKQSDQTALEIKIAGLEQQKDTLAQRRHELVKKLNTLSEAVRQEKIATRRLQETEAQELGMLIESYKAKGPDSPNEAALVGYINLWNDLANRQHQLDLPEGFAASLEANELRIARLEKEVGRLSLCSTHLTPQQIEKVHALHKPVEKYRDRVEKRASKRNIKKHETVVAKELEYLKKIGFSDYMDFFDSLARAGGSESENLAEAEGELDVALAKRDSLCARQENAREWLDVAKRLQALIADLRGLFQGAIPDDPEAAIRQLLALGSSRPELLRIVEIAQLEPRNATEAIELAEAILDNQGDDALVDEDVLPTESLTQLQNAKDALASLDEKISRIGADQTAISEQLAIAQNRVLDSDEVAAVLGSCLGEHPWFSDDETYPLIVDSSVFEFLKPVVDDVVKTLVGLSAQVQIVALVCDQDLANQISQIDGVQTINYVKSTDSIAQPELGGISFQQIDPEDLEFESGFSSPDAEAIEPVAFASRVKFVETSDPLDLIKNSDIEDDLYEPELVVEAEPSDWVVEGLDVEPVVELESEDVLDLDDFEEVNEIAVNEIEAEVEEIEVTPMTPSFADEAVSSVVGDQETEPSFDDLLTTDSADVPTVPMADAPEVNIPIASVLDFLDETDSEPKPEPIATDNSIPSHGHFIAPLTSFDESQFPPVNGAPHGHEEEPAPSKSPFSFGAPEAKSPINEALEPNKGDFVAPVPVEVNNHGSSHPSLDSNDEKSTQPRKRKKNGLFRRNSKAKHAFDPLLEMPEQPAQVAQTSFGPWVQPATTSSPAVNTTFTKESPSEDRKKSKVTVSPNTIYRCKSHPRAEAVNECKRCGDSFCEECLIRLGSHDNPEFICARCAISMSGISEY